MRRPLKQWGARLMIGTATTLVPKILVLLGHRNGVGSDLTFERPLVGTTSGARMISTIVSLFALPAMGQGCPHEGADHRMLGRVGCQIQQKMTIEKARPPRTIWSIRVLKVSVKIDPRHPHLLVEWPARSQKLWRFRMGYRWDANAQAYIFPSLAFKKVNGPMAEYQIHKSKSYQTDKAKPDHRKAAQDGALTAEVSELPSAGWRYPDQSCLGID